MLSEFVVHLRVYLHDRGAVECVICTISECDQTGEGNRHSAIWRPRYHENL